MYATINVTVVHHGHNKLASRKPLSALYTKNRAAERERKETRRGEEEQYLGALLGNGGAR